MEGGTVALGRPMHRRSAWKGYSAKFSRPRSPPRDFYTILEPARIGHGLRGGRLSQR
jgi:hypothetical protein